MNLKISSLAVGILWTMGAWTHADTPRPSVLPEIVNRVEVAAAEGKSPVVVFDLDDTLINTRERNLRILLDFARQPDIQSRYPAEAKRILGLKIDNLKYLLNDTLKDLNITQDEIVNAANSFWLPRFFSDHYCAWDQQNPGAAAYVRSLTRAGARVVYLTGRDIPRMQVGTLLNLKNHQFPTAKEKATLLMKPDAQMDDLLFKKQALATIQGMGEVVGVFENEPANINMLANAFPQATAVFLDTIHSPKPDVPQVGVNWIQNFIYPN